MRALHNYIILIMFSGLLGCLEPYDPDIPDSGKEFLIVDGLITDQEGPYMVKISSTNSFNEENRPLSGVTVTIEEQEGLTETLVETEPGIYITDAIQGIQGQSYRLNINHGGVHYQSTWETILESPVFDSLYFEYEVRGTTDRENDQEGLQFLVGNHGAEDGTRYFRYEWSETWKYGVRWPSTADYLGDDLALVTTDPRYRCWKTKNSTGINIATTTGLVQNVLAAHPLLYAPKDEERFTFRYSLQVKQYALKEEEYNFWKNLKEANQELGGLFDKQPGNVLGNISNVMDQSDVALGYFSASGSHEVRIFVDRADVPSSLVRTPSCSPLDSLFKADYFQLPPGAYEEALLGRLASGQFFYGFIYSDFGPAPIGAMLSTPNCSDCTQKGGVLTKPDFWDE